MIKANIKNIIVKKDFPIYFKYQPNKNYLFFEFFDASLALFTAKRFFVFFEREVLFG
jgi:hypothetical protein